jgi:hypothetical protein
VVRSSAVSTIGVASRIAMPTGLTWHGDFC